MKPTGIIQVLGVSLLLFIAGVLAFSSIMFIFHQPISGLSLAGGLAAAAVSGWLGTRRQAPYERKMAFLLWSVIFIILVLFAVWTSGKVYDVSYDGQAYQQEAIIHLEQGWNPIYDEPLSGDTQQPPYFWMNHYAKGPWINAAAIYTVTGHIEQGKAFHLLLIIASFLLAYCVLIKVCGRAWIAILFSLLLAFNPVSVNQAFTYNMDGQMASLMLCAAALICLLIRAYDSLLLAALCGSLLLIINVKFTGVGYAAVICLGFIIIILINYEKKRIRVIIAVLLACAVGVLIVGYNPYMTNYIKQGHPFYPLAGEHAIDIVSSNVNPEFVAGNRAHKLIISTFAGSSNDIHAYPALKVPFTVTSAEIAAMAASDTRIGGFGPLFGGACLLSLLLLIAAFTSRRLPIAVGIVIFVIAWIMTSVLINPEPWWARYIPQLWFIPVICGVLAVYVNKSRRIMKWVGYALTIVLIVNVLLSVIPYGVYEAEQNIRLNEQLLALAIAGKQSPVGVSYHNFASNRVRLQEAGVQTRQGGETCSSDVTLVGTDTTICVK